MSQGPAIDGPAIVEQLDRTRAGQSPFAHAETHGRDYPIKGCGQCHPSQVSLGGLQRLLCTLYIQLC